MQSKSNIEIANLRTNFADAVKQIDSTATIEFDNTQTGTGCIILNGITQEEIENSSLYNFLAEFKFPLENAKFSKNNNGKSNLLIPFLISNAEQDRDKNRPIEQFVKSSPLLKLVSIYNALRAMDFNVQTPEIDGKTMQLTEISKTTIADAPNELHLNFPNSISSEGIQNEPISQLMKSLAPKDASVSSGATLQNKKEVTIEKMQDILKKVEQENKLNPHFLEKKIFLMSLKEILKDPKWDITGRKFKFGRIKLFPTQSQTTKFLRNALSNVDVNSNQKLIDDVFDLVKSRMNAKKVESVSRKPELQNLFDAIDKQIDKIAPAGQTSKPISKL